MSEINEVNEVIMRLMSEVVKIPSRKHPSPYILAEIIAS
jgi:hypothetical protein